MSLYRSVERPASGEQFLNRLFGQASRTLIPIVDPQLLSYAREGFDGNVPGFQGYQMLSKTQISTCLLLARFEPTVRTALRTFASALFRGGILVSSAQPRREGAYAEKGDLKAIHEAYQNAGVDPFVAASQSRPPRPHEDYQASEEDEYLSRLLGAFVNDLYEYRQALGFCPWVAVPNDHPVYKFRPQRLNLEQVNVWYKCNAISEPMFAFTAPLAAFGDGGFLGGSLFGSPTLFYGTEYLIPGVFVEVWDRPDSTGRLTSPVAPLLDVVRTMAVLRQCHMVASVAASAPIHVVQYRPPEGIGRANRGLDQNDDFDARHLNGRGPRDRARPRDPRAEREALAAMQDLLDVARQWPGGPLQLDAFLDEFQRNMNALRAHRVYLQDYEELARPPEPHAPVDYVKLEMMCQQIILMRLSLPPAMIQAESSRGRITMDYNATRVFLDAQRHLTNEMRVALQHIAEGLYSPVRLVRELLRGSLVAQLPFDVLKRRCRLTVTVTSIPSEEEVTKLYQAGILRHDAYCEYLSQILGIPLERMNTEEETESFLERRRRRGDGSQYGKEPKSRKRGRSLYDHDIQEALRLREKQIKSRLKSYNIRA